MQNKFLVTSTWVKINQEKNVATEAAIRNCFSQLFNARLSGNYNCKE